MLRNNHSIFNDGRENKKSIQDTLAFIFSITDLHGPFETVTAAHANQKHAIKVRSSYGMLTLKSHSRPLTRQMLTSSLCSKQYKVYSCHLYENMQACGVCSATAVFPYMTSAGRELYSNIM